MPEHVQGFGVARDCRRRTGGSGHRSKLAVPRNIRHGNSGLTTEQIAESVDPWDPEERASRMVGERDPSRKPISLERTHGPGTVEQAAVLNGLSTEGLAATLLTHAEESANVDRLLNLGIPLDLAGLFTGPDGSPVLEHALSRQPRSKTHAAIQLQWPTTTLQFCHDDGSDASSGWRALARPQVDRRTR